MLKKFLSIILAISMVVSDVPVIAVANAESAWEYTTHNGEAEITGFDIDVYGSTDIIIPEKLRNCIVTKIGGETFDSCTDQITSLTIPESITSIDFEYDQLYNIKDVFYAGSLDQMQQIDMDIWWGRRCDWHFGKLLNWSMNNSVSEKKSQISVEIMEGDVVSFYIRWSQISEQNGSDGVRLLIQTDDKTCCAVDRKGVPYDDNWYFTENEAEKALDGEWYYIEALATKTGSVHVIIDYSQANDELISNVEIAGIYVNKNPIYKPWVADGLFCGNVSDPGHTDQIWDG